MSRIMLILGIIVVVAGIAALSLGGVALAAGPDTAGSHGEPGDGTGPGQMHQHCYGDYGNGASWGEPGDGTGPGEQRQWGHP